MIKTLRFAAAAAGALAASAISAAEPLSIEDLAKYPAISDVSMSMEGDLLVGIVHEPGSDGEDTAVATWDISGEIDTSKPLTPHAITPGNDRMRLAFADALQDGKVLVFGRQTFTGPTAGCLEGRETGAESTFINKAYMSDKSLEDFEEAFKKAGTGITTDAVEQCLRLQTSTTTVENMLPLDDDHILVSRGGLEGVRYIRYNVKTEAEKVVLRPGGDQFPVLFDSRNGDVLAKQRIEPISGNDYDFEYFLLNPDTGKFELEAPLTSKASNRYTMLVQGVDDATGKYFVITDKFSDKAAVYFYDSRTNQFDAEPVFMHPEFSASQVLFSPRKANFNQVVGFGYEGPRGNERYYIDPEINSVYEGLVAAFPGLSISLGGYNEDLSRVLFTTQSSTTPPTYYLLVDRSRVALVGASRPWVDSDALRETEFVHYAARDGLEIPSFLTLPKGWKKDIGPLPAVVLPHGGPWARDGSNWDGSGWPQFLASRGYAVLQPQYRGSQGWGRELWLKGDAQWGKTMQDDKDDGAAWLVSEGIAAPDRIAIFGYSYGGFAAMAATVRPNSPFQCAIAGAGVSNLTKIGNNWSDDRVQRAVQGRTVKGMDPMKNTDKANIPVLVYHGDRDVRVPLWHGKDFYNAVKRHVEAKLVVVEDMPHSLPWWPVHHRKSLAAIESFLANDCGPGGL